MNSKPISFHTVFGQHLADDTQINAIEIPIIQRDYAQGRAHVDVKRIRDLFVKALHGALTEEDKAIKLDFVYGNIENGKLIPLDGQQRLTTLFLLHWYIAKHENIAQEAYSFLKNFTYKTRFSSQHFCEQLVASDPDFEVEKLSDWITDQNWFMYSWENDPTVASMLVMLDKLHATFKNENQLWNKLIDIENPPISFYFLPLEQMGVTDSLYIKMNSRGKPLTNFEHFKADFEKTIKETSEDLYSEFIHKADIDWVDMLWKYRTGVNVIDDEFMRFYRFITETICHQQEIEIVENDFELSKRLYGLENENAEDNLKTLFKSFDAWKNLEDISSFLNQIFCNNNQDDALPLYTENTNLFSLCCKTYGIFAGKRRVFSLNNSLLLFAVQEYLLNKDEITDSEFRERIRIVRNLVYNSPDEIRKDNLKLLFEDTRSIILEGKIVLDNKGYSKSQRTQEIEKSDWRKNNLDLVSTLNQLEDHYLLQGNISIINIEDTSNFKLIANNFKHIFNENLDYIKLSKALLTFGDYPQRIRWRFIFGNNATTWRDLFSPSKQRQHFERTKDIINQFLNRTIHNFETCLDESIDTYLLSEDTIKDWKYYLLKYPEMREGKSGMFHWTNDPERKKENQYEFVMMNTPSSLGGKHWHPFLYTISKNDSLKDKVSLGEYGDPIIILATNQQIKCLNDCWAFYDAEGNLVRKIEISQNDDNTDLEDRIEILIADLNDKTN